MKASDIMSKKVTTVTEDTTVHDVAQLMVQRSISGVPVVDGDGRVVGMVSEGDLIRRTEIDTDERPSGWLSFFTTSREKARDFIKTHGVRVGDVMSHPVLSVAPDASLAETARLMENQRVKRLPVIDDGKLVGLVTRADLLRALASRDVVTPPSPPAGDASIRDAVLSAIEKEDWADSVMINVIVSDGTVHLWGVIDNNAQRDALHVLVERVAGVTAVEDHLGRSLPT